MRGNMETIAVLLFVYTFIILWAMTFAVGLFITVAFITFSLILIGSIIEVIGNKHNRSSFQKFGLKLQGYGFNVVDFMLNKLEI